MKLRIARHKLDSVRSSCGVGLALFEDPMSLEVVMSLRDRDRLSKLAGL